MMEAGAGTVMVEEGVGTGSMIEVETVTVMEADVTKMVVEAGAVMPETETVIVMKMGAATKNAIRLLLSLHPKMMIMVKRVMITIRSPQRIFLSLALAQTDLLL